MTLADFAPLHHPLKFDLADKLHPILDPENHAKDALHHHVLREHLLDKAKDDKRLLPVIALLSATEEGDDPSTNRGAPGASPAEIALKSIQNFNALNPKPVEKLSFEVVPFDEIDAGVPREGEAAADFPGIVRVVGQDHFANWGHTVQFNASYTLVVRTIQGVCDVVQWAKAKGKKVRVAGFRHTWSDLYGASGDVIIMFLPFESLVDIPYKPPASDWKTELSGIQVLKDNGDTAIVKVMAGTTNQEFLAWTHENKTWTYPLSVIMIEVTFGGTNAPICHGSGFSTKTLSDLVVEVEYVDADGAIRTVSDPADLKVASGAFGLLGIVISLTLNLVRMEIAEMVPTKLPLPLAIPPPRGYAVPDEVKEMMKGITDAQLEQARQDFVNRCKNDYYLEWFWFPYQEKCWVNTWQRRKMTPQDADLKAYPGSNWLTGQKSQEIQGDLSQAITNWDVWKWLSGRFQAYIFGLAAMLALPDIKDEKDKIQAYMSDALHFRRGIQNFRCLDTEWEIPIPLVQGERDYELIQRAWWDGISTMYARKDAPVRVALEMRLMGDSDVVLAPQRYNAGGTVAIEMLTTLTTPKADWASFKQQIADKWTAYKDASGAPLRARPHWAKEWAGLRVRGKDIERYFKEDVYRDEFAQFRAGFEAIVQKNGGSVDATLQRFGNATMQRLIGF